MTVVLTKGGTSGKHIQKEEDVKSAKRRGHLLKQEERPETDPSFMASEGTNPANSFILNFQPLEL